MYETVKYNFFKKIILEKLPIYLPEPYKNNAEFVKMDEAVEGITLGGNKCTNVVYLDSYFHQFEHGCGMFDIVQSIAEEALSDNITYKKFINKNNVFAYLTKNDSSLNEDIPYKTFGDIAIRYKIKLYEAESKIISIHVTNQIARDLKLVGDELFIQAIKNSMKMFPASIVDIDDVITDISMTDKAIISEPLKKQLLKVLENQSINYAIPRMLGLTNDIQQNGAIAVIYPGVLAEAADRLRAEKLLLLPISVHEVICVAYNKHINIEDMQKIMRDLNEVDKNVLSKNVFIYNKNKKGIVQYNE